MRSQSSPACDAPLQKRVDQVRQEGDQRSGKSPCARDRQHATPSSSPSQAHRTSEFRRGFARGGRGQGNQRSPQFRCPGRLQSPGPRRAVCSVRSALPFLVCPSSGKNLSVGVPPQMSAHLIATSTATWACGAVGFLGPGPQPISGRSLRCFCSSLGTVLNRTVAPAAMHGASRPVFARCV